MAMNLHEIKAGQASKLPTPEQMFNLASVTVCLAKDLGKKKVSNKVARAHLLLPSNLESFGLSDSGDYMHITHRFIGRIGRIGPRRWSMRLMEPYWINTEDESSSYRSIFSFEWTDKDVVMATKRIVANSSEDEPDYGFQPEFLDNTIFEPDFINAVNQHQEVSATDCDWLIADIREFSAASYRAIRYSK